MSSLRSMIAGCSLSVAVALGAHVAHADPLLARAHPPAAAKAPAAKPTAGHIRPAPLMFDSSALRSIHTPYIVRTTPSTERALGAQAIVDPTRPVDGRGSIFYGLEALTREARSVRIADREYQVEPILVLGNPGVAMSGRF